jgi:hypothetical protein
MPPYPSNPRDEIAMRLKQLHEEIKHVQAEYETSLLEDKPLDVLRQLKNRIINLKRKQALYTEVVKQRHQPK